MRTSKFRVLRLADGYGPARWEYLELHRDIQGETWMYQPDYNWETWSQYTGFTKQGTDIYEGDIIQDEQKRWRGVVFWRQELAGFYLRKVADDRYIGNMEWIDLMSGGNVEIYNVIGNIWQDGELLRTQVRLG